MQNFNKREEDQCEIYIRWLNEQLSKKPDTRVIRDLGKDMRDGVAFLQLIDVIARERLPLIPSPRSSAEMRDNVSTVLLFMNRRRIRMHHTNPREIIDGNLKATMRLVLSLAAHFKPIKPKRVTFARIDSVDHAQDYSDDNDLRRVPSTASLVADAAVSLADASKAAQSSCLTLPYNPRHMTSHCKTDLNRDLERSFNGSIHSRSGSSSSGTSNGSSVQSRTRVTEQCGYVYDTESDNSSQGGDASPQLPRNANIKKSRNPATRSCDGTNHISEHEQGITAQMDFIKRLEGRRVLLDEVKSTRDAILNLQDILLRGKGDDDDLCEDNSLQAGHHVNEEVVILRARLTQSDHNYDMLKRELSSCKEECNKLQGEKSGLVKRLDKEEQVIVDLKSRLLRSEVDKSREQVVSGWMTHRDEEVVHLRDDVTTQNQIISRQKLELQRLHQEMITRDDTESHLLQRLSNKEQLVANLQDRVSQLSRQLESDFSQITISDDSSVSTGLISTGLTSKGNDACKRHENVKMSAIYASQDSLIL